MTTPPALEISKLRREFPAGEGTITALNDIDLVIQPGDMVAIVGQSGSGKSTLMNILGCLDRPTSGTYKVGGRATSDLAPDELAELRREHFGFIFQRYHLLGDLTALGNVEVPAIYSGTPPEDRKSRATQLLGRLGLEARTDHRPGQLSGGQQQRVSIARALMNGGEIVLADEPTGALDTASGEEVMRILKGLHNEGHTVIIVTHDMEVAEHCERVIEIRDGAIINDRKGAGRGEAETQGLPPIATRTQGGFQAALDSFGEALRMAILAMKAHRMRTFLTMLGIIIGIASVVCVVALGEGSRQKVLTQIASIGTNTLEIMPGRSFGDTRSGRIRTLVVADADALARQPYADSVTPTVSTNVTLRYGATAATATINGVGEQYFRVRGLTLAQGRLFDASDVADLSQGIVIDQNTVKTLFPSESPIGKVILLGSVPARVTGVTSTTGQGFGGNQDALNVYMPYTAVNARMLGTSSLRSITMRVKDDTDSATAQTGVTNLLTKRHGTVDFIIVNTDQIRATITATTTTLTLLISAIAIISLIVGGIGVMNIMLVSVTERTSEIGVRMAVGARQRDILQQFLIEAVLVCLIGGVLGILVALGFGVIFSLFSSDFHPDLFGQFDYRRLPVLDPDRRRLRLPAGTQCRPPRPCHRAYEGLIMKSGTIALSLVAMMLSACAATPYSTPQVDTPAHFAHAGDGSDATAVTTNWWMQFNDPALNSLVSTVLEKNNDLAAAALRVQQAQLQAGLTRLDQFPQVSGALGATTSSSTRLSANLSVSYEADLWGRLAANTRAANWEVDATDQDRQTAQLALIGTVCELYWRIAYTHQQIAVGQQSLDYAVKVRDLITVQHNAGAVSGVETAEADQSVNTQQANLASLQQQLVEDRSALTVLLGGEAWPEANEPQALPDTPLPDVRAGLPAELLGRRPDLRAAEDRLRESLADVDIAKTSLYPGLNLTASGGASSSELGSLFRNPTGTVAAALSLPFLDFPRLNLNVKTTQKEL